LNIQKDNAPRMSVRFNWLTALLVVALLASVTTSGLLMSSNAQLSSDKSSSSAKAQMNSILAQAQMTAQAEIKKVDEQAMNLSMQLSPFGLNGTAARAFLDETIAANANIISILTYDTKGIIIAAAPAQYQHTEGSDLSGDANVQKLLRTKMPTMSNEFISIEGPIGAVLASPVFDSAGKFIGAASILFNASRMMTYALPPLAAGTSFTFFVMQPDGFLIYDVDPAEVGTNLFSSYYAAFPQLQALGWRMVNESTGYGTYSYYESQQSQQVVNKECYWTTVGAHSVTWRVVIVHRI
jgi:hypothetical protein